jgi:O-succinylbenzoate synthase
VTGARPPLPEVRPAALEVVRTTLPLLTPFATATGTEVVREVLLVRARDEEGHEGWGECGALSQPGYTGEWVHGADAVLRRFLLPAASAGRPAGVAGHPMAAAAVEAALLDLRLAVAGTDLPSWLGAARDRVPAGVAVGVGPSVDALVAEVADHVAAGYQRVKLKVRPGWDVEPVRAVRAAWPDLPVGVDANGSYRAGDDALTALDGLGLVEIEQPLPADDLVGSAGLTRRLATPVCLDESVTSVATLESALALGALDHLNLKPARVGGLASALAVLDRARDAGVPVWVGGMLATGVGKAVDVALAALPGVTLPGDLPASRRWFARDLTEPWELLRDGTLPVRPRGPVNLP